MTCMMRMQQVHELQNTGSMPLYIVLLADNEVHDNKAQLATGVDVVQIMFDEGQEDIQS